MYQLRITDTFDAAHRLHTHKGECRRLHGHTYKVEVQICAKEVDEDGMVIDFGVVDDKLKPIIQLLDHSTLLAVDDHLSLSEWDARVVMLQHVTAEGIAHYIFLGLRTAGIHVSSVEVFETLRHSASYSEDRRKQ